MEYEFYPLGYDTTVDLLVTSPLSIFGGFKGNSTMFLSYTQEDKSNFDRIVEKYSKEEVTSEAAKITARTVTIVKAGTTLLLPKGTLDMEKVFLTGRNLFVKDISSFSAFYGSYLDLLKRDDFTPAFRTTDQLNDVDIRDYQISVWVWSRALSQNGTTLLDVTKYIESCSTTVNGSSNSFTIALQAISKQRISFADEVIDRVNVDQRGMVSISGDNLELGTQAMEEEDKLPIPWFKKILQQNDIFFIRFERLTLETIDDRISKNDRDEISASNLPGKVFDMIGLVDSVSTRFNSTNTDISVEVSGRDLTKLLIEDGSYFFPLLFTENADTLFFNTQDDSKWFKRTYIKGTFDYLFFYKMQSIKDSLGFMVNQLANLGVCNDVLFSSYDNKGSVDTKTGAGLGGRRTQALRLTGEKRDQLTWNVVSGIWQIVDLLVDEQIEDRRIANSLISNPNSNLLSVVESFCQRPFVEFFGDTYGDKFTFIARTPPFTKAAIISILSSGNHIDVNLRDVESFDLNWDTTFYTWFEMDPRNMFLGRSESMALAYLPVVYFPEIAESFGNKQMKVTDNYISNKAFNGEAMVENRDEFKQKVIEDFIYVIESYCYLPFTETGTFTLKRDRRIKAKTWVKIGNQLFYVESVSNTFTAIGERIDGMTTLHVTRGMYIDFIYGKTVTLGISERMIDYWSPVKLDTIRSVLIEKLSVGGTDAKATVAKNTVKVSFGTDREAFDFFLQRKQV